MNEQKDPNQRDPNPGDAASREANSGGAKSPSQAALPVPARQESRHHGRRGVGGIWIVIAVAALGLAAWQWIETRGRLTVTQQELAARLAAQDKELGAAKADAEAARETGEAAKARLAVIESRLAEFQSQYAALDAMYQDVARGRDESVISDAEQLVGLAAQQLQLAGNTSGALLALSQAEARLAKIDRAQLANVRRLIGRDIEKLRALPEVDLVSVSVKLENVIESVDSLSPGFTIRPTTQAMPAIDEPIAGGVHGLERMRRFARDVWNDLRDLVRIQRFDRLEPALLSPSQEFFLRENLKLRLLNARLALLSRDGGTFRSEVRQAQAWIERHFDTSQKPAVQAIETLSRLSALDIMVRLPRVDETLAAIRAVQLDRQRSTR